MLGQGIRGSRLRFKKRLSSFRGTSKRFTENDLAGHCLRRVVVEVCYVRGNGLRDVAFLERQV